ncbi:Transposase [Bacteroidales bacterium Barb4]|nr:Transposase [Bacteroidales bacterium Barb4]
MTGVFCHAGGASLGQIRTGEKSNEITVVPGPIKVSGLEDCTVSIDADGMLAAHSR